MDAEELAAAHARYAAERDAAMPRRTTKALGPPAAWAGPGSGSSVFTPTTRGTWRAGTILSAVGSASRLQAAPRGLYVNVAAIDVGSTSTRLLVTGPEGDLVRRSAVTRLGDGVGDAGVLDPARVGATLAVLGEYRVLCDEAGVGTAAGGRNVGGAAGGGRRAVPRSGG